MGSWRLPLTIVILVAVGCSDEKEPPVPIDVKITTFNIGLAGSFVPNEAARRPKVIEALANSTDDIICVQEAWFAADKAAIKAAVANKYPHTLSFETNLDTPIDDPKGADGTVPPAPPDAPCAKQLMGLNAAVDCLKNNCSDSSGAGEDARVSSASCVSTNCTGPVASLLGGADKRCYGCVLANTPAATFAAMRSECGTNPKGGLAFGGQSSVMILSRFPISEPAQHVLPGTWNRRTIARGTVALPNGASVDVYCNHLTPVFLDPLLFYTGQYGGGKDDKAGWEAENLLQVNKLIAWQKTRADKRAVILGDMNVTRKEGAVTGEYALASLQLFEATYTPGNAAGYTPICTYCGGENPNIPATDTEKSWLDRIFLANIPASAVKTTERIYTESTVDGASGKVPLSDHYGLRSTITFAP